MKVHTIDPDDAYIISLNQFELDYITSVLSAVRCNPGSPADTLCIRLYPHRNGKAQKILSATLDFNEYREFRGLRPNEK